MSLGNEAHWEIIGGYRIPVRNSNIPGDPRGAAYPSAFVESPPGTEQPGDILTFNNTAHTWRGYHAVYKGPSTNPSHDYGVTIVSHDHYHNQDDTVRSTWIERVWKLRPGIGPGSVLSPRPLSIRNITTHFVNTGPSRNWVLVKVTTEEGIHGWGEASVEGKEKTVAQAIADLERQLEGRVLFRPIYIGNAGRGYYRREKGEQSGATAA